MGWLWFVIGIVPAIGLVQVGRQAMADRFTYLPLIGLLLIAVWGMADLLGRRPDNRRAARRRGDCGVQRRHFGATSAPGATA